MRAAGAEASVLRRLGEALAFLESDPANAADRIAPLRAEAAGKALGDEVEYWYAHALERAGRTDDALAAYRAVIRLAPRGRYAARARDAHRRLAGKEAATPVECSTPQNLWRTFTALTADRDFERAYDACMSGAFRAVYPLEEFMGAMEASREVILRFADDEADVSVSVGVVDRAGASVTTLRLAARQAVAAPVEPAAETHVIPLARAGEDWRIDLWP